MKHILSCDIGTSTLKSAIITDTGTVLAKSHALLKECTAKSALEWKPALKATVTLLKDTLKDSFPAIDAICISGHGPTLVSRGGTTLMWNKTPGKEMPQNSLYPKSIYIPHIELFKKEFPEEYKDTPFLLGCPEFFIYELTGFLCTLLPEERFTEYWWPQGYDEKLPPFVFPGTKAGNLTKEAAEFLELSEDTSVYCGAPDFISAMVGTNTLEPGKICNRAGSSEGINLCTSKEIHAPGLRTMPSIIPGLWNLSYLIPESGSRFTDFINQLENVMGIEISYDAFFDVMMGTTDPSPLFEQGKYLIIQTALKTQDGLNLLYKAAAENGETFYKYMTMTGGQAVNDTWCHIKSNITGMNISIPECTDAELMGNAAFALVGMEMATDIKQAAERLFREDKTYSPENE